MNTVGSAGEFCGGGEDKSGSGALATVCGAAGGAAARPAEPRARELEQVPGSRRRHSNGTGYRRRPQPAAAAAAGCAGTADFGRMIVCTCTTRGCSTSAEAGAVSRSVMERFAAGRCGGSTLAICVRRTRQRAFRCRPLVEAALVIVDGALLVASRRAIGAGEILHRIGHVGVGIEQAVGGAAIAHRLGGAEADLHQAVVALADHPRVALALDMDDAAHQRLRHAIGGRVLGDQRVVRSGHGAAGRRHQSARTEHSRNPPGKARAHARSDSRITLPIQPKPRRGVGFGGTSLPKRHNLR